MGQGELHVRVVVQPVAQDGRHADDPVAVGGDVLAGAAGNDAQVVSRSRGGVAQPAQADGHAVQIVDGVGQHRHARVGAVTVAEAQRRRVPPRRLDVVPVPARTQHRRQRHGDRLDDRRDLVGEFGQARRQQRRRHLRPGLAAAAHQHRFDQRGQLGLRGVGVAARRQLRPVHRPVGLLGGAQELGVLDQRGAKAGQRRGAAAVAGRVVVVVAIVMVPLVLQVAADDAVDVVLQDARGAVLAVGRRAARPQRRRHARPGARAHERGEGAGDRQPGVIVAAAHQAIAPVAVDERHVRMALGIVVHPLGRQTIQDGAQRLFVGGVARAVAQLQVAEHQQAAFQVFPLQPPVHLRQTRS